MRIQALPPSPNGDAELTPHVIPADVTREAVRMAALLSEHKDYARFDFLYDGDDLYGGEVTCYPASGLSTATPDNQTGPDTLVNDIWDLRRSWFLTSKQSGFAALYASALKRALD